MILEVSHIFLWEVLDFLSTNDVYNCLLTCNSWKENTMEYLQQVHDFVEWANLYWPFTKFLVSFLQFSKGFPFWLKNFPKQWDFASLCRSVGLDRVVTEVTNNVQLEVFTTNPCLHLFHTYLLDEDQIYLHTLDITISRLSYDTFVVWDIVVYKGLKRSTYPPVNNILMVLYHHRDGEMYFKFSKLDSYNILTLMDSNCFN